VLLIVAVMAMSLGCRAVPRSEQSRGTGLAGNYANLTGTLNGAGSSFQAPFQEEAIDQLREPAPNLTVNYQGGGSGKGKQALADKVVDFAGTDSLVKDEEKAKYKGGPMLYFPVVAAPITVAYNLEGIDLLQMSPATLAGVFQGEIDRWNDPAIRADNPGVTLPDKAITVAHRSDGSGTTSNFTKYMKTAAGALWRLDAGDTVKWPSGTQGGNGNAGVSQIIKNNPGSIGYVDYADAQATGLLAVAVQNSTGAYVRPTIAGTQAAVEAAAVKDDLTVNALNVDAAEAYPITAMTYVLVYRQQPDASQGALLRGYVQYLLTDAQQFAEKVDFAPLPPSLRDRAVAQLSLLEIT